jgi:xylan 1,4-beta-xylosidase
MRTYELARKYGLTVQGAVTWAFEFEDQPAFAGFRELATNGIDKPVLNVFRMMGLLGGGVPGTGQERGWGPNSNSLWLAVESSGARALDDVVAHSVAGDADINAVATGSGNRVDVLVWNYHDADLPAPASPIRLVVDGIKTPTATIDGYRMDSSHSNSYSAWQQMGSPEHPTAEQREQLEKAAAFERPVTSQTVKVEHSKATIELSLPRQGVAFFTLIAQ